MMRGLSFTELGWWWLDCKTFSLVPSGVKVFNSIDSLDFLREDKYTEGYFLQTAEVFMEYLGRSSRFGVHDI